MGWNSILKIVVNSAITGAITALSSYFVQGSFNPEISVTAAFATGILSFLIELQKALKSEPETTSNNPNKKGNVNYMTLF